jgi:hypothetical protein
MKRFIVVPIWLLVAVCAAAMHAADTPDLRRGVPDDTYLVVLGMHNPERDFQKPYYDEIWKTVQDTEIIERALKIVTSRMGEAELAQANSIIDQLREATSPIDLGGLAACQQMVYAQQMVMFQPSGAPMIPTSHHLVLLSVTPEVAASTVAGMKNLFALVEQFSEGNARVVESQEGPAALVALELPGQSPMQPVVAQMGGVFALATSPELLKTSLAMLNGGAGKSKFDDPRLAEALAKLPAAEDSLVFYDGRSQFKTLGEIAPMISNLGGGDPNVERIAKIVHTVIMELAVFDYEVTVEYTEGNLNRTASYGKLLPGTDESTLRKMVSSGEPFQDWQNWVPAGAVSYSLGTGVNLHVLYDRIMQLLNQDVPESAEALAEFEKMQEQFDLYLDRDILQAFTGEYASVTVKTDTGKMESVLALRCAKPERINELVHRGFDALQQIEFVRQQQLRLVESKELEGFEAVSATLLMLLGPSPVIGYQDGWMYIGQSAAAVKKVLDTKAGNSDTILGTEAFQRLNVEIEGPVDAISYANTAENIRAVADSLRKAGLVFQMAVAMSGNNAEDKSLDPVKEFLALMPDAAKILEKFDFLESKITVVQQGSDPDSYSKRSVTVVRAPEAAATDSTVN